MSDDKEKSLSHEEEQFDNSLIDNENTIEKDSDFSDEGKNQEKLKKDEKERSSDNNVEGDSKEEKKLSDEEKDSISQKKDTEELEEKLTDDSSEDEKVDNKHLRHSAHDNEEVRERDYGKRMIVEGSTEEEPEEELTEEELAKLEEEQLLAEKQAKRDREKLEKEARQAQFREANERSLRYQQAARLTNEANQRAAADERERLALEESVLLEAKEKESGKKDDFMDKYLKRVAEESKNKPQSKPLNNGRLKVKSSKEDDLLESKTSYSSGRSLKMKKKPFSKEEGISDKLSAKDKNNVDTGKIKLDKADTKKLVNEHGNEGVSLAQSAGPSMGQDSSEGDEAKKNANAKKVAKKASEIFQKEAFGKEVTVDGVAVQLTKGTAAEGIGQSLKGTTVNQLFSELSSINDRKSAEENARKAMQKGIDVLGKKASDPNFTTSADKFIESVNNRKLGTDKPSVENGGIKVDKSRKAPDSPTKVAAKPKKPKGYDNQSYRGNQSSNRNNAYNQGGNEAQSNEVASQADKSSYTKAGITTSGVSASADPYKVSGVSLAKDRDNFSSNYLKSIRETKSRTSSLKLTRQSSMSHGGKIKLAQGEGVNTSNALKAVSQSGNKLSISGHSVAVGKSSILTQTANDIKGSLSQHSGALATIAGQLAKPTSDQKDEKEMNPTSFAKSARQMIQQNASKMKVNHSSITAQGIVNSNSQVSAEEIGKNAGSKLAKGTKAQTFGTRKGAGHSLVNKSDGSLRIVREGHDSGIKEIKADAPGLAKQESNKKLLNGRDIDTRAKFKDVKKDATQEYHDAVKTKEGGIRLTRDGKKEAITREGRNTKNVGKLKTKSSTIKSKVTGKTGGKMSNVNVGRGAKISTKTGPLAEQAEKARQASAMMRQYWAKNGLSAATQGGQLASQGAMVAKVVAKKAAATVAATGISGGAAMGGAAVFGGGSGLSGDFSVIAASVFDSESDDKALTQDAVDMLQARLNAYAMQANGKEVSSTDLEKAGTKYVPLEELGFKKEVNGKKVTSGNSVFKFVDRDGNPIKEDKFLLDDYSDLVMPSDAVAGTGGFGGDPGQQLGPSDTGHPVNVPYYISQGLHQFAALDLASPANTPIYAVSDGTVVDVNTVANGINGNYLIHTLPNGEMIYYGHMIAPPLVKIGDTVKKGQHIGYVGMTGLATGYHIHFDIRRGGLWSPGTNPWKLLPGVPSGAVGITIDPRTSKGATPDTESKGGDSDASSSSNSSSSSGSNSGGGKESNSKAKKDSHGQTQMDIMLNMIGALETGGQVYGKRDYANFINVEAGAEVTATLGWSSFYGVNGREWLRRFKKENPDLFKKLDKGGQVDPVLNIEWEATGWQANPTQKASIVDMLTTEQGKKLQDSMTAEREAAHWRRAASKYTKNMRAIAWYTNIAELAGTGVADPFFDSLNGNYDSDYIYKHLTTAWNRGGATIGAPLYSRRHALYHEWINKYYKPDEEVDLDNIEVTGAGAIDDGGSNPSTSGDTRAGQILLIKEILSMAAIGSHYGQPNDEEDFFKYCIEILDHAIKGKDGKGVTVNYIENEDSVTAQVEFKVLVDMYELEKMDTKFHTWDLSDKTYGDKNPQAYIALPNDDFEEIFNVKIEPITLGEEAASNGGGGNGDLPYLKWAMQIADDDSHGYSQIRRNGNPDYDCSSFIWYALDQAGFDVGTYAFATPTMPTVLQSAGFTMYDVTSLDQMEPGDILLREGHSEIYIGDGKTVGAHADELGGIAGAQGGDQGISTLGGIGEISAVPTDAASWTWGFRPPKSYTEKFANSDSGSGGNVSFGSDGLLKEKASDKAQSVINMLMAIPGHANGSAYHKQRGIDDAIDELSAEEAVWVLHRIEGAGFGQTGGGYAGIDSPESHKALVDQQLNKRFDGSIHKLLKHWGTYSYSGY